MRYPKGIFAMSTVYSFTGAAILASIIFSLLLFLSIDEDPWMKLLLGGLAVIFELGKFFAWYEFGERRSRKNYTGAFSAFGFYFVLAAISVGGSIGGINSATNTAQNHVNVQKSKANVYDMQIAAIDKQIELNNTAAEKYIQMGMIANGVSRIQKENAVLRQQQQDLALERDSLPVVTQGSVIGLIDSLARAMGSDTQTAQLWLVVFLSILLDFFAAFFVGLIGEELRFRRYFRENQPLTLNSYSISDNPGLLDYQAEMKNSASDQASQEPIELAEEPDEDEVDPNYQKALAALHANEVKCSKKAMAGYLELNAEEVDDIFRAMLRDGFVSKKPNRHYQWNGLSIDNTLEVES